MLHRVQPLIESSVSKRKVHFGAGWKFFIESIFFSVKFYTFVQINMFTKVFILVRAPF